MNPSADKCDVLVVGAGPGGSSCARRLHQHGFDVQLIDKARFPRDKVCAGWITPPVIESLGIDLKAYSNNRVLQPITGFRVGLFGEPTIDVTYNRPVSYGIRRCEFDEFLLQQAGVSIRGGEPVESLQRDDDGWIVNDSLRAGVIIGAGGTFCPVARWLDHKGHISNQGVIVAQEVEYQMSADELATCRIDPQMPELYFYADLLGYAWCFRKQDYLNIGVGRADEHNLTQYRDALIDWLVTSQRLGNAPQQRFRGHAYRLATKRRDPIVADRLILVGDSAGLAHSQSGEGIRPAIESGLIAADVLAAAESNFSAANLTRYTELIDTRFGRTGSTGNDNRILATLRRRLGRRLMQHQWFVRSVVVDRWFLNRGLEPYVSAV